MSSKMTIEGTNQPTYKHSSQCRRRTAMRSSKHKSTAPSTRAALPIIPVVVFLVLFPEISSSFVPTKTKSCFESSNRWRMDISPSTSSMLFSSLADTEEVQSNEKESNEGDNDGENKSFWMPKGEKPWWQERKNINDLQVGQELYGHVVQELLDGKTGPKLYFECGVGRIDKNDNWQIVTGMLRLPREKASVSRKRAARLRKKDRVPLFVSRIQKECGRLEVCDNLEEVEKYSSQEPRISVKSLKENEIIEGTVLKVYPYGAIIDIGAKCHGLLHINRVAELYGYIQKESGLQKVGIEKGAEIKLAIESIKDRRISLDFPPDVKEKAQEKLEPDQIVEGTVLKLFPYGAMVELGVNCVGLLHISKVANLYGKYIDKEKGLVEAGLETGARVQLMVESVNNGKISLDFTPSVKQEAAEELAEQEAEADLDEWAEYANQQATIPTIPDSEDNDAAEEAETMSNDDVEEEDDDDDYYDDYDEQNDIEESLGLDMY